jgi:hypothetical protein
VRAPSLCPLLWPSPTYGRRGLHAKEGGLSAPLAKTLPSAPDGQKSVWPSPPFGLWEGVAPFGHRGPKRRGGGALLTLCPKERLAIPMAIPTYGGRPAGHEMAKSNPSLAITRLKAGGGAPYGQRKRLAKSKGGFGHRMAKRGRERLRWPSHSHPHQRGMQDFFSALTPTTLLEWGGVLFGRFPRKTFRKLNRLAKAPQKKAIEGGGAFIFGF